MDEKLVKEIDKLVAVIKDRTAEIDGCKNPKQQLELQTELAELLSTEVQKLSAQGLSIGAIQEKLRAAMDRVPNSYAPDAATEDVSEEDKAPADKTVFSESANLIDLIEGSAVVFSVVDKKQITCFEEGIIDEAALFNAMGKKRLILKNLEGMILVLSGYREDSEFENFGSGGNILSGPDGEALFPEWLELEDKEGSRSMVCEPVVYKTGEDIQKALELVNTVDLKDFTKQFSIKKLLKAGAFPLQDEKAVKKRKAEILQSFWHNFLNLRAFYRGASLTDKWLTAAFLYGNSPLL